MAPSRHWEFVPLHQFCWLCSFCFPAVDATSPKNHAPKTKENWRSQENFSKQRVSEESLSSLAGLGCSNCLVQSSCSCWEMVHLWCIKSMPSSPQKAAYEATQLSQLWPMQPVGYPHEQLAKMSLTRQILRCPGQS